MISNRAPEYSFEALSFKMVKVTRDGIFAGFLERVYHPTSTSGRPRFYSWDGRIDGVDIRSVDGLKEAKQRVNAILKKD